VGFSIEVKNCADVGVLVLFRGLGLRVEVLEFKVWGSGFRLRTVLTEKVSVYFSASSQTYRLLAINEAGGTGSKHSSRPSTPP